MPILDPSQRAAARNHSPLFLRHDRPAGRHRAASRGLQIVAAAILVAALAAPGPGRTQEISAPIVHPAVKPESVRALASLALTVVRPWRPGEPVIVRGDVENEGSTRAPAAPVAPDPVLQTTPWPDPSVTPPLIIDQRVDGISSTGMLPPDIAFAVGPNHIVQMVNNAIAIYDKSPTGKRLLGPVAIHSLWAGLNSPCAQADDGDPIVRYDHFADRWLISQFEMNSRVQCIAISKGPNPVTDGWYAYGFPLPLGQAIADYPKIAVWPDGYYMGTQRGWSNKGVDVWAFDRAKMLIGAPADLIQFTVSGPSAFLMPSDVDGDAPPTGSPNFFARHVNGAIFGGQDRLEIYEFTANWNTPTASSFSKVATLPTAAYTAVLCGNNFAGNCAAQPDTPVKLETAPAWLMWRLQFRIGRRGVQFMVVNHTVNADGKDRAGIRWYVLTRRPPGAWRIEQQGTYSPDSDHRFIGSIAMNDRGLLALGFSVSGPHTYPSIRVAFQGYLEPPGRMSQQRELTLVEGHGSQTDPSARWGDYSSMEIDPQSPCKFWYAHEYYSSTSAAGWKTAITSFQPYYCEPGVVQGPSSMAFLQPKNASADCQNRDVQRNDQSGGPGGPLSSSVYKNSNNSISFVSAYVSLSYGKPNATYHVRIRCGPFIGDMETTSQGGAGRGFDFPRSLVGSQYGLELYLDGDPSATLESTSITVP